MTLVEHLKELMKERLTSAAAEDIFRVLKQTNEEEEDMDRQRELLEIILKPELKLNRIDRQQLDCREEELFSNLQLYKEDKQEPAQIKEEQEDQCISKSALKEETDVFMVTVTYDDSDQESNSKQFLSEQTPVAEGQDQEGSKHTDSTRNAKLKRNNTHKCDTCGKSYQNQHELKRHQTLHTGKKSYPCKTCGKIFHFRCRLTAHARSHTGEKPFSCKTCGMTFTQSWSLTAHMRTHTGERPHSCDTCGKRFCKSGQLVVHMRTHTGERPYFCETCGRCFSQSQHLIAHMRTHTGEKPFSCKTCGKSFSNSSNLTSHVRIHTGEKPYTCQICGKSFNKSDLLTKHRGTHTTKKPYSCDTCGRIFIQRSSLTLHTRSCNLKTSLCM